MWSGYLVLIRHAATAFNAKGERARGWIDLPLSVQGVKTLPAVSEEVAALPIERIVTSDLRRAVETAHAVRQAHPDVPVQLTPRLRTWHIGLYSGQLLKHVQPLLDYAIDHPAMRIPQGESFQQFLDRTVPLMTHALQRPELLAMSTHKHNLAAFVLQVVQQQTPTSALWRQVSDQLPAPGGALYVTPQGVQTLEAPALANVIGGS